MDRSRMGKTLRSMVSPTIVQSAVYGGPGGRDLSPQDSVSQERNLQILGNKMRELERQRWKGSKYTRVWG